MYIVIPETVNCFSASTYNFPDDLFCEERGVRPEHSYSEERVYAHLFLSRKEKKFSFLQLIKFYLPLAY